MDDSKWEEDKIYDNLPPEEKETIKKEAIEDIKKTNPHALKTSMAFIRKFLLQMKIRELVRKKYGR
jgi:hypothetical protein